MMLMMQRGLDLMVGFIYTVVIISLYGAWHGLVNDRLTLNGHVELRN